MSNWSEALQTLDVSLLAVIIRCCEDYQRTWGRFPTPQELHAIVAAGR